MTLVLRTRRRAFPTGYLSGDAVSLRISQARYKPRSSEARSSLEAALLPGVTASPTVLSRRRRQSRWATRHGKLANRSRRSRLVTRKTTVMEPSSSP